MDSTLRKKISKLAKRIGPKLNWKRDPRESAQWNTKDIGCLHQSASNIIHDIAHWAVSSPLRRAVLDFGLGAGPESQDHIKSTVTTKFANDEEVRASALGIWWEKELGLDWKHTARYHSWDDNDDNKALRNFWNELERYK